MPKKTAQKRKAADFAKAKLKLGKGKQQPSNAIDTSFKARSIALPSQSIAKHTNEPTTRRKLALNDLILHLKHYNAPTRRDAISGLRELLDSHPQLLDASLPTLITAAARAIGDEDASVRKALLDFFIWLFPRIPPDDLIPHSTTLLLFTTSAQTHIFPEIRVDAIRFLNVYLDHIPLATIAGWDRESATGHQVLEGYLGILSAGTTFGDAEGPMKATSTASVVLTAASKLVVLQSLATFLQDALARATRRNSTSSIYTWYLASWFATREAYEAFDGLLKPSRADQCSSRTWRAEADLDEEGAPPCYPMVDLLESTWSLDDLSCTFGIADEVASDDNSSFVSHLARTLHSTLVATFLDCAPSVFSPNGNVNETQAKLVLAVAEITRHLYNAILRSSDSGRNLRALDDLKSILGYMTPYFPFRLNGTRDIKTEQAFQSLNLIYCELSSLVVLTAAGISTRPSKRAAARGKDTTLQQTERVSAYVIQLLRGEATGSSQLGRPLTPDAYLALLPTIWSLVNNPDPDARHMARDVILAVIDHGRKVPSKSAVKQMTLEFVARILLLDTESQFTGHLAADLRSMEEASEWISHLPKCLWELGSTNSSASHVILRFLVISMQRKSRIVTTQTTRLLRSQLVPYFTIVHPTRGQILGPFSKLPSALRRLALCLVALTGASVAEDGDALGSAVPAAVLGTAEEQYWSNLTSSI
ncbi:Ipi1-N domain-containing protein [Mycena kentingensis (nom. inval.)]|nr:Ipi1-N domain-containing protein [Mycena kentingensis (nom. inval.)]